MYSIRTSSSKPSSSMTFLAIQGFMTAICEGVRSVNTVYEARAALGELAASEQRVGDRVLTSTLRMSTCRAGALACQFSVLRKRVFSALGTFVSNEGGNCVLRIRAACLSLNRGSWSRLVPRKKFPAIVCSPRLDSSRLVQVTRARGE